MWGISDFPTAPHTGPFPSEKANASEGDHESGDPHLRSTQAMIGYHIQASDGSVGHVSDFIMDDESWAICRLVAETGHGFQAKRY